MDGNPGIRIIFPIIGIKKPAPAAISNSRTVILKFVGRPISDSLSEKDFCVLAMQIGNLDKPNFKDFGTYHLALDGETNWYEYACFITDEAIRLGLKTTMTSQDIKLISSDGHPAEAKRPMNSRFNATKIKNTFMLEFQDWKQEAAIALKLNLVNS